MKPLRTICLLIGFFALVTANSMGWHSSENSIKNSMKPTDWLSASELESLPSLNEISVKKLESMSVEEGADMLNKLYHLAQVNEYFEPTFSPQPSEIQTYLITPNNQKISFKLNELPKIAKETKDFGDQEVTIFITGLPQKTERIKKATRKLMQAYMQRYNGDYPEPANVKYEDSSENRNPSSSEEDYSTSWKSKSNKPAGNFVIVDLGSSLPNFKAYATLDIEETGEKIGDILVQLTDKADVPQEIIHVIGSNIAAHVAGAAARQYTRETGHQLRRVTGLDPSKIYAKKSQTLTGLARGDADFVDVIHTSAYGMGIATRCGDADFYPDGPTPGVSGSHNVVEASMRAVRYFAESVVPGNERNFPAESAISLKEYKNQNISGKRVYMGIGTEQDVEGDFVLQVNAKTPFGRRAPTQKQQNYVRHNMAHQSNDSNKRVFLGISSLAEHFG
ncbi:vitellogenin-2-like [Lucilia sericata]|uniref:vitellogenin-2-like n=1 Tax=Lucilia sericata TaxID=13632 RepID=UPI0018A82E9F|nr:vitellogenin-2-like [Lucilia sericata]